MLQLSSTHNKLICLASRRLIKKHFARGATEKKQNIITIKVEYYVAVGEISFLFTPDKTITICTYSNIFKKYLLLISDAKIYVNV